MSTQKARELPEFVDDLVRIGTAEITAQLGAPPDQAAAVMQRVASGIVSLYARTTMYVPAGFDHRNGEIWRKYTEPGRNADGSAGAPPFSHARVEELANEYQLTVRQIYSVVSAKRLADRSERGFPSAQLTLGDLEANT